MDQVPPTQEASDVPARRESWAGHLLVAVSACVLTISIVGSAVFLVWKAYDRFERKDKVRLFIASLENRSDRDLELDIQGLKSRPALASYVIPELIDNMAHPRSERHMLAMVHACRAFLTHQRIQKALFALHSDSRETIAAEAVAVLGEVQPPDRAANWLGRCLDVQTYAVVDEVCAGLFRLREPGRAEMARNLDRLSVERRIWLVEYLRSNGGESTRQGLEMLRADQEPRVREAANQALATPVALAPAGPHESARRIDGP